MLKVSLLLTMSVAIASAWFMPTMSFGTLDDKDTTNVDKNYIRYDKESVVVDTQTHKMYYDSTPSQKIHFYKAWDYCQNLEFASHKDWRVPSKDELRSLLELSRRNVTVKHAFQNIQDEKYWTSTEDRFEQAWFVDFDLGRYSTAKYKEQYRVVCVRNEK